MKKLLLLLLIIASVVAHAQISWYKMLSGTIDKYPVTLHLHKAGHRYLGFYYYNSQQIPIYLTGEDTSIKGKINLMASANEDATETFLFSINGNAATGSWKKDEKSKALNFTATETPTAVSFTYIYTEGEKKLRPLLKQSPLATFFAASIWPAGTSSLDAFFKKIILQAFGDKTTDQEIGKILLQRKAAFFKNYDADNKDVTQADLKDYPSQYDMDETREVMMAFQSAKIATLADYTYAYTGGAHGNYGTSYSSFDLVNQKQLKLNDVLTAEGKKKLPALLEKSLRNQYKLKSTDTLTEILFENKIAPNDNFYVTGKGIGFLYNPYEIAAYAVGEINLFISFKDLEPYLQPSFKTLLQ